jgi:hypothetical protein
VQNGNGGQLLQDLFSVNDAKQDLISSYMILKEQVVRKDRKGVLFTEKNCFVGTEAIDCVGNLFSKRFLKISSALPVR